MDGLLLHGVFGAADGVLHAAFKALGLAVHAEFGVTECIANGFLDGAACLFGAADSPVLVHDECLSVRGEAWSRRPVPVFASQIWPIALWPAVGSKFHHRQGSGSGLVPGTGRAVI